MRSMNARGAEVIEPRFVGVSCANVANPGDCLVCHISHKVVTLLWRLWLRDWIGVAIERWIKLIRFTLVESVEVFETLTRRPIMKRPGRADLGLGRVMSLAEHGSRVTVIAKRLGHDRSVL